MLLYAATVYSVQCTVHGDCTVYGCLHSTPVPAGGSCESEQKMATAFDFVDRPYVSTAVKDLWGCVPSVFYKVNEPVIVH
jgi:hypothetical protein